MLVLQVALVSVCLLSGAVHGQEDKNFDIKKLLELYKTAKKGGFNFEKVNFDAVSSLSQIIKWQKYNNTSEPALLFWLGFPFTVMSRALL